MRCSRFIPYHFLVENYRDILEVAACEKTHLVIYISLTDGVRIRSVFHHLREHSVARLSAHRGRRSMALRRAQPSPSQTRPIYVARIRVAAFAILVRFLVLGGFSQLGKPMLSLASPGRTSTIGPIAADGHISRESNR